MSVERRSIRPFAPVLALWLALLPSPDLEGQRFPGETWMRYVDVAEAGFDAARLEEARRTWEDLPSSAFMVVADGAVVAAWGDVGRRFMCHSVRKSFLSALYGVYWDRGEIELNKRLSDLGIDDYPGPLLETEREARILDLLKARSGVFHPAAYAGRTDSRPRGSEGPGRYFAYNNWDFNTLATILMQETGDEVFTSFDRFFGKPLGMEDWRVSDGYYHYERDKSRYPAYPFRMSARDAARFGLLFAREGTWGGERLLSKHWVRRSSALYSIDNDVVGYGFMWWVYREPRFERYGMYSALGVGNQMIAVLPEIDLVIVNRANTYAGENTPRGPLLDLVEEVLEARVGAPVADPSLASFQVEADPLVTSAPDDALADLVGEWAYPPPALGLSPEISVEVEPGEGHLVFHTPVGGTFALYLQPDGSLHAEDSHRRYWPVRHEDGSPAGIAETDDVVAGALVAAADGRVPRARSLLARLQDQGGPDADVVGALLDLMGGDPDSAERGLEQLYRGDASPLSVERTVNRAGSFLLQNGFADRALQVFELNTRVFPEASNAWDSLGEAYAEAGRAEDAVRAYERSLDLDPDNENAREMIARLRAGGAP
jgi:CubicO group peptidase (beta-lactamase class C family)